MKAVQVQLKRGESSKSQEAKKKTHSYQQQQIDEEPWVNLEYYDKNVTKLYFSSRFFFKSFFERLIN